MSRDSKNIRVKQADLEGAAKQQLLGHLQMAGFERYVSNTDLHSSGIGRSPSAVQVLIFVFVGELYQLRDYQN